MWRKPAGCATEKYCLLLDYCLCGADPLHARPPLRFDRKQTDFVATSAVVVGYETLEQKDALCSHWMTSPLPQTFGPGEAQSVG